ncbi:hypothetical protein TNCV_60581 [Trichonephila clavipes]|nr:hypothetical protein TNCV_60581 [Trichonephila clavipes]
MASGHSLPQVNLSVQGGIQGVLTHSLYNYYLRCTPFGRGPRKDILQRREKPSRTQHVKHQYFNNHRRLTCFILFETSAVFNLPGALGTSNCCALPTFYRAPPSPSVPTLPVLVSRGLPQTEKPFKGSIRQKSLGTSGLDNQRLHFARDEVSDWLDAQRSTLTALV